MIQFFCGTFVYKGSYSESTIALTMAPFILDLVKLKTFVSTQARFGESRSVSYKTADIEDLHTLAQCPFLGILLSAFWTGHR